MKTIQPVKNKRDCVWKVPGSKSMTNRALLLASLASGKSTLEGFLHCDDTIHMRKALGQFGIKITDLDETTVLVDGGIEKMHSPKEGVFVGNSGTTVRFITALSCLMSSPVKLIGDEEMANRPIVDMLDAISLIGIKHECETGCPPLKISASGFSGGTIKMKGNSSSQYFSALLMVAVYGDKDLEIIIEGELVSRPYVNMTIKMMENFGGKVLVTENGFIVKKGIYKSKTEKIEPDASAASYPFAYAFASGTKVSVPNIWKDSLQGDYRFIKVLEKMGAKITEDEIGSSVEGTGVMNGIEIDMHHISDTVMTLAAIAPLCNSPVTIKNIANIRIKETDRLMATVNELKRLGQEVEHGDDWMKIIPSKITPAEINCYKDHRMAMSFAILGMVKEGVTITDLKCVSKTYPDFWKDMSKIY